MEDERRLFHLFVSSAITEIPANGEQLMANSEWRTANSVKKLSSHPLGAYAPYKSLASCAQCMGRAPRKDLLWIFIPLVKTNGKKITVKAATGSQKPLNMEGARTHFHLFVSSGITEIRANGQRQMAKSFSQLSQ
jgi:hypothetical protein